MILKNSSFTKFAQRMAEFGFARYGQDDEIEEEEEDDDVVYQS